MKGTTHILIGTITYADFLLISGLKPDILDIPICVAFSALPDIDIESSKISKILSEPVIKTIESLFFLLFFILAFYFSYIKKVIPVYTIFITPIMVLFLKFFSKNKILKKISLCIIFLAMWIILYKYSKFGSEKNILLLFAIFPFFEHRSISHSLLGLILISVILYPLYENVNTRRYFIVAILSYVSHLFMGDIFTKNGIKIFYPFSKKSFTFNIFNNKRIYKNLDIPFLLLYVFISILLYLYTKK